MRDPDLFAGGITEYLREIAQYPLLTPDEEIRLAREFAAGRQAARRLESVRTTYASQQADLEERVATGDRARKRLIESNLRLVVSIARRYRGHGLSLLDLIQEGNIGLQTGIEKYDWRKGYRLSTYVFWWIRQAMTRALANDGRTIRLPVHVGDLMRSASQVEQQLELELGHKPSLEDVALRVGIHVDRLRAIRAAAAAPMSLDTPLSLDSELTRGDAVVDESAFATLQAAGEAEDLQRRVALVLEDLPSREREVLKLRYGLGRPDAWSLAQIGQMLGVTRERARQIEGQALRRLRADARLKRALVDFASV